MKRMKWQMQHPFIYTFQVFGIGLAATVVLAYILYVLR